MAYVSQEMKAKLAPAIKAVMKKYGVTGSLSVRNHSTLVLTLKGGKLDFIGNYNARAKAEDPCGTRGLRQITDSYMDVNVYWTDTSYTGKVKEFFAEVIQAMKGPDFFDDSDIQSDYFHCSHYIDINVGRWDKPYVLVA